MKTTQETLENSLFPEFRKVSFSPPKHSEQLCISLKKWEFLCHTLYLKKYPFLLGPKGCGKSSVARELAEAMGMEYYAFDMGQAFKPKKMFVGGLIIGDDGKTKGEYAPVFYRKDKFKLLKSGNFWLSEDTSKPNKGWDAAYTRICTWGEFKDITGKFRFWFFNLHMDHIGVVARRESAKLVISKIKEMCGKEPVILTGDFNVDQTSESYQILHESGILSDSYETAQLRYATNGTCTGWNPDTYTPNRIDHIFVTKNFVVEKYGVLTDTYRIKNEATGKYEARIPSDHFPVKVVLKYNRK